MLGAYCYLDLRINYWRKSTHADWENSSPYWIIKAHAAIDIRQKLLIKGIPEPADDQVDINLFREYDPMPLDERFSILSGLDDPVADLMDVPEGAPRPFGTIQFCDEFFVVQLYAGADVYDDLQATFINGGALPGRVEIGFAGVEWRRPDSIVWDTERNPLLPITKYGFTADVKPHSIATIS